jgi:hypothetical protein
MNSGPPNAIARPRSADRESPGKYRASAHQRRSESTTRGPRALARYTDGEGQEREIIARAGRLGSVLVVDRDLATQTDRRLLAHLAADEPPENAALICSDYLHAARAGSRRCRPLTDDDARTDPLAEIGSGLEDRAAHAATAASRDGAGRTYMLQMVPGRAAIPELRWSSRAGTADAAPGRTVSLREVVAHVEQYDAPCSLTEWMLVRHRSDSRVSTSVLEAELVRVRESPIVLNRMLREAVLMRIEKHGQSMSEIALRCGRVKRDRRGNESGETSWLARRLGLLSEGGQAAPSPWIHSDVLALIARRGLGVSPREVEVA